MTYEYDDISCKSIADDIRELAKEIDKKVNILRANGYGNARVGRNDALNKLEFSASRTTEIKL